MDTMHLMGDDEVPSSLSYVHFYAGDLSKNENAWCREAREKDERNNEERGKERVSG